MKKLEDIPKKTPFKVPDGYFDQLPTAIQARMKQQAPGGSGSRFLNFSLKFVLPLAAVLVALFFWFRPTPGDDLLGDVDTEQIALYLDNTEHLDVEDIIESNGWTKQELDQLEDTVYSNMEYSNEEILDDIELDNL